ncbi:FoF1 ATP synthase subunit A [Fodinicola feengrottensis]|uniref:FoF1 ATP synthase subunit A n=1 Tax=Fodinicola feengrottensis TaxID=435914 RepID=UPI00244244FC|nr:F0F1 ATP synthase subunit A [Fodinicola feengrottensis]
MPLAVSVFFFIWVANWLEVIPTNHLLPAPTADVNLTYALGLFTVVVVHVVSIRQKGVLRWAVDIAKGHEPGMAPIWIFEELTRPFTLALRLFGNMFAGGIMLSIIALLPIYVFWLPEILWKLFDLFVGVLQAVIFALLIILYLGFQLDEE